MLNMYEKLSPELRAKIEADPKMKAAIDKVGEVFEASDLSAQIVIKAWAAMLLCKRHQASDDLVGDLVNKVGSLLKAAHTIELTNMMLKPLTNIMPEMEKEGGRGLDMCLEFGAGLEIIHNQAAKTLREVELQFRNICDLIPQTPIPQKSETSESRQG
jgi:hypothetical protein